jgi:hypothetical protein
VNVSNPNNVDALTRHTVEIDGTLDSTLLFFVRTDYSGRVTGVERVPGA